ncbi:MAG TPA: hypothetical protein VGP93_13330, partial [Polyangiaceae bacterium]|nr:hypothetical protein [Polyangiaceae bacterium]
MKLGRLGRRAFLQGTGTLLALPLLPSLFEKSAQAANSSPNTPLRFFAIKSYSTQHLVDWYPRFAGNGYQVRPFRPSDGSADGTTVLTQQFDEPSGKAKDGRSCFARFAPLADLAGPKGISHIIGPALNRHAKDLLLVRGLDFMPDTNHNDGGMLGNYAASDVHPSNVEAWPTIDQTLAFSKRFYPNTPFGPR